MKTTFAAATIVAALLGGGAAHAKSVTIALVPGLTTDAFYITMHRGAEAAAKDLGDTLVYQGAPDPNVTSQVSVLNAVIARHPDAIIIAPDDKVQLIQPLKTAPTRASR
jgi:ribose transport system substrate-binding protein